MRILGNRIRSGRFQRNQTMPKLHGFDDHELHPNVHEALKVLLNAQEVYARALNSIDGQYLKSLDIAYAEQADAVRALFGEIERPDLVGDGVRPRFE